MKIEIRKVENGFITSYDEEDADDGTITKIEHVTPLTDDCGDNSKEELTSVVDLLYQVKECFGYFWQKHSEFNIKISVEKTEDC